MSKLSSKITLPVILSGLFAITIFMAFNFGNMGPGFYAVILFLAVFVFFFGFAIGQEYASPIKKLLEKAIDLSNGNLDARVYLETKDELAELAKILNQIAENMQESETQKKATEQSVEMKVRAKTQAFEETINALEQKIKNRTIEMDRLSKEVENLHQ